MAEPPASLGRGRAIELAPRAHWKRALASLLHSLDIIPKTAAGTRCKAYLVRALKMRARSGQREGGRALDMADLA